VTHDSLRSGLLTPVSRHLSLHSAIALVAAEAQPKHYAALILHDEGVEITQDKIAAIGLAAGVQIEMQVVIMAKAEIICA